MMNIMEVYKMNENILIENAILAFLHHYPEHNWVNDYKVLLNKVQTIRHAKPEDAEVRKRGRPAKRQRKKETTSNTSSKEESETT